MGAVAVLTLVVVEGRIAEGVRSDVLVLARGEGKQHTVSNTYSLE